MKDFAEFTTRMQVLFHEWNYFVILFRLFCAVGCGGAIGLTRSVKRRGAGFKTHALVCVGACLVMLTGQYIYMEFEGAGDISRLAAQVVSGVSFLGVGTIMVTGHNQVKGLTTAAGLWACSGIGIALGIGFYFGGISTTIIVLLIYRYMNRIDEFAYEHSRVLNVYVEFESRKAVSPFILALKEKEIKVMSFELNKSKKNKEEIVNATLLLEVNSKMKHEAVIRKIRSFDGINLVEEL